MDTINPNAFKAYGTGYRQIYGMKKLRFGWIVFNQTTGEMLCPPLKTRFL